MKHERWITPQGLTLLQGWARDGLSDAQIAHNCGVSAHTLRAWRREQPEIAKALSKGREVVDREVENALLKRCLGYSYTEVSEEETAKGVKWREVVRHVPGSVTAQMYWLSNRCPDRWSSKPEEGTGSPEGTGIIVLAPTVSVEGGGVGGE